MIPGSVLFQPVSLGLEVKTLFFSTFTLRALPNKSKLKSAGQTKQNYLHRSGNPYTRGVRIYKFYRLLS